MGRHLAVTVSNRTRSQIKITHQSYTDLVPSFHTTLTKAIPSRLPLRNLVAYAVIDPQGLEIRFKRSISLVNRRKFRKLDVFNPPSSTLPTGSVPARAEKKVQEAGGFQVFQTIAEDGSVTFMVITTRDMSNWMSELPDGLPVSSLTLPGSHNSCALYGWPIGTCHTRPLTRQLEDGIRFIDLRLAQPKGGRSGLVVYHGIQTQHITFRRVLCILATFLKEHPLETVVVSIKQEDFTPGFAEAVNREIQDGEPTWWLETELPPTLSQARGKLVLFSRFNCHKTGGVRLPIWPNNSPEIWESDLPGAHVAVQDWYNIGSFLSIPKKSTIACLSLCRALRGPNSGPIRSRQPGSIPLIQIEEVDESTIEDDTGSSTMIVIGRSNSNKPTWVINYLSASSLILGFPNICAKGFGLPKLGLGIQGVNTRVARWLTDRREITSDHDEVHGVVCLMDFYQSPKDALVSLLIDCNF
ncbi:hypothetical protein CROQUDRAFT_130523 [Cronartium quercuum f. sp. fusiforme G11]|uniref:Phosphatidylinositol-specific phospholipase C X domain-containing protein n=1 Tax=Cronartium quercuum f. sp. fusiforme G11 TaxID=708437 RepID=A0A9P6NRT7_9BASI|nr:hypothetical protein CROQUDRAFT_130523 [Cronartium quercuum f. sp. fusiforme G11]